MLPTVIIISRITISAFLFYSHKWLGNVLLEVTNNVAMCKTCNLKWSGVKISDIIMLYYIRDLKWSGVKVSNIMS